MNLRMEKVTSLAIIITLLASFAIVALPVRAQTTLVKLIPATASATYVGQEITFAGVIEDVTDLAGIGWQITWNTTYLDYVDHELTVPVEDYSSIIPPSPYAGLIHEPELIVSDSVDPVAGTYDCAASTLGGPGFDGDGTAFWITLNVTDQLPYDSVIPDPFDIYINFTLSDCPDSGAVPIPHDVENATVTIVPQPFAYPPLPLLKVTPELIECTGVNETVTADVVLMGADYNDLSPFWDVAGIDVVMNFDPTMIEALSVDVDPDGWFESFFNVTFVVTEEIDNIAGTVHVAFIGLLQASTVYGTGRVFSVDFKSLTETDMYPPGTSEICLENPVAYMGEYVFDSIGGYIDTASPVGSTYNQITKHFLQGQFELISWEDNGDGILSVGDQCVLNDTTSGFYFDYYLSQITGSLNLTLARTTDFNLWATNSITPDGLANNGMPGKPIVGTDGGAYNGFGLPDWTGNFSLAYPVESVNSITVHALPFSADEYTYTLTEGVDFIVHADEDLVELLIPQDVHIINEHWVDGINNTLGGWPWINYIASAIQSVDVDKHDGFGRVPSPNAGFQMPPPGDWWFEPDWPWELEGYWALGYFPDPSNWPAGSEWWINYTACSVFDVDYNTDPTSAYVEFEGTYDDYLALSDPTGETFNERYPFSWNSYTWTGFVDDDTSGDISVGDFLEAPGGILYRVDGVATDLIAQRKPWIQNLDPNKAFFGMKPIVSIAGNPHPDRDYSPWLEQPWSVALPHVVECATYQECFIPSGGFIDIYTQYPDPYGGQGLNNPSDMFWPQKNITLCANVTYAQWPEQNKDVAFEIIDPNGMTWGIFANRTNDVGVTCVFIRLPWPCDNPELYIGEWTIIGTVDISCTIYNDTLTFKYDYKVNIWNATVDKPSYKHCENITVTIDYGSYAMQDYNITFAITAVDASGVPFGYAYETVVIGGAVYCSYKNGVVVLAVHVAKFARPPIGTIYVVALNGLPQDGGSAETPVYPILFSIEAAWA
jgi:hypothetical protein